MNKFLIPSCIAVLVLLVLLYSFKPDYFKQSSKFGNINRMILVGPKGDIVLQPVGDIDSAINAVGDGIEEDTETAYQTKAAAAQGAEAVDQAYNKLDARIKANKESAVQRGAPYSIKMGEGNAVPPYENLYMQGLDKDFRVAYNAIMPTAKWSLV